MSIKIERSALLAHSAIQIYELVNDVEAYPEFIKDCKDVKLLQGNDFMIAKLILKKQA